MEDGEVLLSISTLHKGHNQAEFDEQYKRVGAKKATCREALKQKCQCSSKCLLSCLQRRLPFLPFLTSYKLKSYFFKDLISGLCIGFMGVPQSLGFVRIAKVPEIMGLYTSVFPVFVFFFFTSAKHVSLGTVAILSLAIRTSVESLTMPSVHLFASANHSMLNSSSFMEQVALHDQQFMATFLASLCCTASIILILLSFLKLGFVASFMSESFISGFLSAVVLRVTIFQYKDMLELKPAVKHSGVFEMFLNTYEIFKESPKANVVALGLGLTTLVILLFIKNVVNDRFRKKFKFPIPIEMIIVIAAVFCNRGLNLHNEHGVEILTSIKPGMPSLVLPSATLMYQHVLDAFLCAIVAYLLVAMMAKTFSQKYGYQFDSDQEMFALGISGLLGCFFNILLPSTAPPRCFLMESTGGKTQATHLWTAAFTLFTMLVFANFMRDLPVCVLASIILASLVPMLRFYCDPIRLYQTCKYDFLVWMVTYFCSLVFSVQEGMVIGIGFSMILVHIWILKEARGTVLRTNSNGLFLDREHYPRDEEEVKENLSLEWHVEEAVQQGGIFIFKFEAPLYFNTLSSFKKILFNKIPSPTALKKEHAYLEKMRKKKVKKKKSQKEHETKQILETRISHDGKKEESLTLNVPTSPLSDLDTDDEIFKNDSKFTPSILKCLILDFSAVSLIDVQGARCIQQLHQEYSKYGVVLLLCSCNNNVSNFFKNMSECAEMVKRHFYPTLPDAFIASFAIYRSAKNS